MDIKDAEEAAAKAAPKAEEKMDRE